jgi:hypothetical protein
MFARSFLLLTLPTLWHKFLHADELFARLRNGPLFSFAIKL